MTSHHILAELARERQKTLLAEAENHRQARQAKLHRQQAGPSRARRSPLRLVTNWLLAGPARRTA